MKIESFSSSSKFRRRRRRRRTKNFFLYSKERRLRLPIATPLSTTARISMSLRRAHGKREARKVERKKERRLFFDCSRSIEMPTAKAAAAQTTRRRPRFSVPFSLSHAPLPPLSCPFLRFQTQASSTPRRRRPGASESRPDTSGSGTR